MDPIVGQIKHRSSEALDRFLAKHREHLRDWVGFRLGVPAGRGADPSDALQDVSIKLWQAVGTFDGTTEQQLLSWFQRHLRWWVVDLSRRKVLRTADRAGARSRPGEEPSDLDHFPGDATSPSRLAGLSEKEAHLRSAGGGLTNEQLTLVALHDVDGVPLKEIARQLAASPVEVARTYLSGIAALRDAGIAPLVDDADREAPPRARLLPALEQLPAAERQAVLLKHLEGFTMEEAAEALETTPAAVGSAVYRGMKALRALLADAPDEGGPRDAGD